MPSPLRPDLSPLRGSVSFRAVFVSGTVAVFGPQAAEVALLVQAKQLTRPPAIVGPLGLTELPNAGPSGAFGA